MHYLMKTFNIKLMKLILNVLVPVFSMFDIDKSFVQVNLRVHERRFTFLLRRFMTLILSKTKNKDKKWFLTEDFKVKINENVSCT